MQQIQIKSFTTPLTTIEIDTNNKTATIKDVNQLVTKQIPQLEETSYQLIWRGKELKETDKVTTKMTHLTLIAPMELDGMTFMKQEDYMKMKKEREEKMKEEPEPKNNIADLIRMLTGQDTEGGEGGQTNNESMRTMMDFVRRFREQGQGGEQVEQLRRQQQQRRQQPRRQMQQRDIPPLTTIATLLNEDDINMMMAIGFPRNACIKALFICGGNANGASDWLLTRDASLENLTELTHRQYLQGTAVYPDIPVDQANGAGNCTRSVTKDSNAMQPLYTCQDCQTNMCEACSKKCHQNHTLQYLGRNAFTCQCSLNDTCQATVNNNSSTTANNNTSNENTNN